jgi:amino acid adenylation domain-containing protein
MKTNLNTTIDYEEKKNETVAPFSTAINTLTESQNDAFGTAFFQFDLELKNKLQGFVQENDSTFFLTLLTSFQVLMHRYNNREDILAQNLANDFTDLLHTDINGQICFADLLKQVTNAINNSSGGKQPSGKDGLSSRVIFAMQRGTGTAVSDNFGQININQKPAAHLAFIIDDSVWQGMIKFSASIYSRDAIKQMIVHYKQLLYSIVREPDEKIGKLLMLTPVEEHELVHLFNNTEKNYPAGKTIVDLFEQQAADTPGNTALYIDDRCLTYSELNKKANQLARHLIEQGVTQQDNVALIANRDFDMVIALYAILKAGAAYVPVPPDYPLERQQHIIKQSSVKYILTDIDQSLEVPHADVNVIDMRTVEADKYEDDNLCLNIDSRQLAYTIYTSGSTGVPKGVMIEHHSAVNLISWVNTEFNVGCSDRLLFITSLGFDLSVYDLFGMLSSGGSVVMARKEDILNVSRLSDLLQRFNITFWDSVPTTMDFLVERLAANNPGYVQNSLRLVFLSGDWIPVSLPGKINKAFPNAQVISLGGATEGTVWSNYFPIKKVSNDWNSIPYGKPIANNAFYILNDELQPVPYGVIGELYIGGVGVARGYANDSKKTIGAFVPDPFTSKWGGRMYRTGDLGRMLPDRTMEFIGRIDNQVKIRGHRVELSEIECVIRQINAVSNAAVLFDKDKQQLAGYIVPGKYYDRDIVIAHVKAKLPDYMVPNKWIELDSMPLTVNGKTDIKALQRQDTNERPRSSYVAPRNEEERTIAAIWQEILAKNEIGVHDNFFDLGGQSLTAVELISEIGKKIGKDMPVNILYKHPTIAKLSSYLREEGDSKKWKSLVTIKPSGNKMPVYIVHGDGLSLSNFHNLAEFVDPDQPVFSLQPLGLSGSEEPENIADIARHYLAEILEHNPTGPYALGGYSFGGYVAIEMKKQLESMGRMVKMLAIFDTDARNVTYKKDWIKALPMRIKRQVPKFLFIAKSMFTQPVSTIKYQYNIFAGKINSLCYTLGIKEKPELKGINKRISSIDETHLKAFRNYDLTPFNDKVYLFKAKSRLYFVDDFKFLGWGNYARKGVAVIDVPGDHKTMFLPPNVRELGRLFQNALDNC